MDSSSPCLEVITFKYRDIRQEVPHRYSRDSGLNMPKWSRLFPSQRGRGFSGARQAEPLAPITPTIFLRVVSNIITDNSLQSTSFDSTRCQSTGLRVSLIHQTHTSYQPFGESRRSRSGQVVCRTIARPLGSSTLRHPSQLALHRLARRLLHSTSLRSSRFELSIRPPSKWLGIA